MSLSCHSLSSFSISACFSLFLQAVLLFSVSLLSCSYTNLIFSYYCLTFFSTLNCSFKQYYPFSFSISHLKLILSFIFILFLTLIFSFLFLHATLPFSPLSNMHLSFSVFSFTFFNTYLLLYIPLSFTLLSFPSSHANLIFSFLFCLLSNTHLFLSLPSCCTSLLSLSNPIFPFSLILFYYIISNCFFTYKDFLVYLFIFSTFSSL